MSQNYGKAIIWGTEKSAEVICESNIFKCNAFRLPVLFIYIILRF